MNRPVFHREETAVMEALARLNPATTAAARAGLETLVVAARANRVSVPESTLASAALERGIQHFPGGSHA